MAETKLTPMQEKFIEEYLLGGTVTDAAIRAGYKASSARTTGSHLLEVPKVKKAIEERRKELSASIGVTPERIVQELARIAFVNLADVEEYYNGTKTLKELDKNTTAAITEFEKSTKRTRVKFADKLSALIQLGKHLGMFKEQVDHNVSLSLEELVTASLETPKVEEVKE